LITVAILAARKLALCESNESPSADIAISAALAMANKILKRIDDRWPREADLRH
jgi:hypothetical protein